MASKLLKSPAFVFSTAIILRTVLLLYAHWQDANSPVKYTDIDYYVFTDAARFVAQGRPPYTRDTYRYTPLLAWLLTPTVYWFDFGKVLFALADILAGWLLLRVLIEHYGVDKGRATMFSAVWTLNPMVANISTRGSSEALLGVIAIALLKLGLERKVARAALVLGFAVHWKIYPFIYAASLLWFFDSPAVAAASSIFTSLKNFFNRDRVLLAAYSFTTFMAINLLMFAIYQQPYLEHSWTYHLTRLDHRHNFSPYNTLLHLSFSPTAHVTSQLERLAFIPQLFISAVAVPFTLAKKDLAGTMLCQTFAFVTFNKVCTSQYFLWYMVFLPVYLPKSRFLHEKVLGMFALLAWVAGQGWWLAQAYNLEFLGLQAFVPGLWYAGLGFFAINCWLLALIIRDISSKSAMAKTPKNVFKYPSPK